MVLKVAAREATVPGEGAPSWVASAPLLLCVVNQERQGGWGRRRVCQAVDTRNGGEGAPSPVHAQGKRGTPQLQQQARRGTPTPNTPYTPSLYPTATHPIHTRMPHTMSPPLLMPHLVRPVAPAMAPAPLALISSPPAPALG